MSLFGWALGWMYELRAWELLLRNSMLTIAPLCCADYGMPPMSW